MSDSEVLARTENRTVASRINCPLLCAIQHGANHGEEDWVHMCEALEVADGVPARLCTSVDPDTGAEDGPYVIIGSSEYTLDEAEELGMSLVAIARVGAASTHPSAG